MVPQQRGRTVWGARAKGDMWDCNEFCYQLGLKTVATAGECAGAGSSMAGSGRVPGSVFPTATPLLSLSGCSQQLSQCHTPPTWLKTCPGTEAPSKGGTQPTDGCLVRNPERHICPPHDPGLGEQTPGGSLPSSSCWRLGLGKREAPPRAPGTCGHLGTVWLSWQVEAPLGAMGGREGGGRGHLALCILPLWYLMADPPLRLLLFKPC